MKKLILAGVIAISPIANAIEWNESPVEFEELRGKEIHQVNQSISKHGGLDRLVVEAKGNDAESQYILSRMYHYGIVKKRSLETSFDLLEKSSSQNHVLATFQLAKIKLGLDSVSKGSKFKNDKEGIKLMLMSAESGIAEAQYWVGLHYIKGELLVEDRDLGLFWMTRSKTGGFEPAYEARRELLKESNFNNMSFDYVQARAIEGNHEYLVKLAEFYSEGWVVQRDEDKSIRLLITAAELGSKNALSILKEKGYTK